MVLVTRDRQLSFEEKILEQLLSTERFGGPGLGGNFRRKLLDYVIKYAEYQLKPQWVVFQEVCAGYDIFVGFYTSMGCLHILKAP